MTVIASLLHVSMRCVLPIINFLHTFDMFRLSVYQCSASCSTDRIQSVAHFLIRPVGRTWGCEVAMITPRIAVVDDDLNILDMTCLLLAIEGYESVCLTSCAEAVDVVHEKRPALVIVD